MELITYSGNEFTPLESSAAFFLTGSISVGCLAGDALIDIPSVWPGPNPPRGMKQILTRRPSCIARLRADILLE